MSGDEKRPLPEGWRKLALEDVAHIERGITFPASSKSIEPFDEGIVCLRTSNVQEKVDWDDLIYVPNSYVKKETKLLRENDILISMANSYELVGKVSFVAGIPVESSFGGFIAAIRANDQIESKYLFYHLRSSDTQESMRRNSSQTVNIANLSLRTLYPMSLRIAPLSEQRRIVAEIEKQFTRLDTAVASLKRAQANLERYKASVLKAACEGRLVPQDPDDEPAEKLLQRILAERRKQWEEQEWAKLVEKAQKKVAQARRKAENRPARLSDLEPEEWEDIAEADYARYLPKNDKWKEKYKEPVPPNTAELPELPEGWVWASIDQIANHRLGKMLDKEKNTGQLHPYLRNANVRWFDFDLSDLLQIRVDNNELDEVSVYRGDLVICEGGEPGRCAVWKQNDSIVIQKALHRVRPGKEVSPYFLSYHLAADAQIGRLEKYFTGSTIKHFTGQSLRGYLIMLPPPKEQIRIVEELEQLLSIITANEKAIAADLARAERLRQSILQQAFSGQLV